MKKISTLVEIDKSSLKFCIEKGLKPFIELEYFAKLFNRTSS